MKKSKRILSLLLAACLLATPLASSAVNAAALPDEPGILSSQPTGTLRVGELTVENHQNPLGVDIAQPNLAWKLSSDGMNQAQTKYRILVASSEQKLDNDEGDLWDTTQQSDKNSCILYGGTPLQSRQRVYWKVMVWDANGTPSAWSDTAWWEMAFTEESDWKASWIGKDTAVTTKHIITNSIEPQTARYVRLKVNEVGLRAAAENIQRLQFMEWEIYSSSAPSINLAAGKSVTSTNQLTPSGSWSASCLTDGLMDGSHGYSTGGLAGTDLSGDPILITIDLGESTAFDTFKLYGRTDAVSIDGDICPNYPKQYDVEISQDGETFTPVSSVSIDRESAPRIEGNSTALPLFAKEFEVDKDQVASARLYITGLGLYEARINGKNIADTVFDPGETDFKDRVMYVTYDVTDYLNDGGNAIGVQLGNGMYNVGSTPGRYQKHDYKLGEDKLLAQLEITNRDGSVQTIISDESWKQTDSPIVFSSWYGGEDYDATKEVPGWAEYGTDRSSWSSAGIVDSPTKALSARNMPPLRVQREITPVGINRLDNGDYVVDMGVNFAGTFDMTLTGLTEEHRGAKIEMWPSELLNADGSVDQGATGSPIWDSYTVKGAGEESFHLTFMYHGFRYLQVKNCPVELTTDNFRGYFIRTDNDKVGTFETSSDTLNQINDIINVSVESNMYNTLTDCPHREKLGWLEVSHLMYYSMAYNFDIQSWMKKITLDMTESQLENGMMPSIAPEYPVFSGGFRSDPTWGGAAILDPWYTYQVYGDDSLLEIAYPMMAKYIDYIKSQSKDNLVNFGLGDWGGYDTSTPLGLVVSATYYNLVDVMSQIADKLNRPEDAQAYRALAAEIKSSFNKTYYNEETGQYGSGSQASNACPLFAGLVPDDQIDRVLDNLVANIESRGWHLSTGEVGLRQMFVVLGKYGRSDVVYKMATNKTMPSYWYFIENGRTSLPEFWDMNASQNHCMMGHIQEWFYRYLAGIDHAQPGYKQIVIKPYLPDDLEQVKASTMTSYGRITSEWNQDLTSGRLTMHAEIPVGTTADLYIPALGRTSNTAVINGQTVAGSLEDGYIVYRGLGSGSYDVVREPAKVVAINAAIDREILEIGEIAEYAGIAADAQITVTAHTEEGDTLSLAPKAMSYAVDNPDILSVDQETGIVKGLRDGIAEITVHYGELSQTLSVRVNTSQVVSIAVSPSKPALNYVGDEVWLEVTGTIDSGKQIDLTGFSGVELTSDSEEVAIRPSGSMALTERGTVGKPIVVNASFDGLSGQCTVLNGDALNLARAEGTTVRSSSFTKAEWGDYSNESAVDGDRTGNKWGSQGGWSDGTPGVWPDWYQVDFGSVKTISAIDLTFLQDNFGTAGVPTLETKAARYGMTNYKLQYWDGAEWQSLAAVTGNDRAWTQASFEPVSTSRVRILFDAQESGDNQARIVEIEIWESAEPTDVSFPVTFNGTERTDLATAVCASESYSVSFDDQKLLEAVEAASGPVRIELSVEQPKTNNLLELRSETLAALADKEVTFVLRTGVQSVTVTANELFNSEAIQANSSVSSPADIFLRLTVGETVTSGVRYTNFDLTEELPLLPVVETNKTILKAVLDYAAAAIESGQVDSLIPTVKTQFMDAFNHATRVYESTASTQEQVDQAWPELMKAIHLLDFQAGDKTRLNELIQAAEQLNPDDYDNAQPFVDALEAAQAVSLDPDALVREVDEAVELLEAAMEALILKQWDSLRAAVAYAETIDLTHYVSAGQEEFTQALNTALAVLDNSKSTQQEIDSAADSLLNALLALRLKADKTLLSQLVQHVADIDLSGFSPESVQAFEQALHEAKQLLDDETLTQEEDQGRVDDAVRSLTAAYTGLTSLQGASASKPAATGEAGTLPALICVAAALSLFVLRKKKC